MVAFAGPPLDVAGGLESADIRKSVCDILEGRAAAFRERMRRLRVRSGAMSLLAASLVKAPAAQGGLA